MTQIQKDADIVDWLYNCTEKTTFAVRFGENLKMTKYATISEGPFRNTKNYHHSSLAEPYNVVCRVDVRKDPSADFTEQHSISYNPEDEVVYVKRGVNRFDRLHFIQTNALEADYESSRNLIVVCDECGSEIELPKKNEPSVSNKGMRNDANGDAITPCCHSVNWTTRLR